MRRRKLRSRAICDTRHRQQSAHQSKVSPSKLRLENAVIAELAFMLVVAALAGVVAAILPARRASRVDILKALAYE